MCQLAGLGALAGGTFTSGGTEATFAGLLAARQAAMPGAWRRGVGADPPVVVCGEHAHYGVARAVGELGLGTDHAVVVPSREYRMDVAALERTLDALARDRRRVMAVVATAGTTATGSFDDLEAIGRRCAARAVLFHAGAGERAWDQGLRSFACSRRVDALEVWVAIQRYGAAGLGALCDRLCGTARTLYHAVLERPRFEAMHAPETNILCFRFVGDRSQDDERLDRLNLDLREAYNREGDGWITTTVLGARRVLRVTVMNPRTSRADVRRVLDGLESVAEGRLGAR